MQFKLEVNKKLLREDQFSKDYDSLPDGVESRSVLVEEAFAKV